MLPLTCINQIDASGSRPHARRFIPVATTCSILVLERRSTANTQEQCLNLDTPFCSSCLPMEKTHPPASVFSQWRHLFRLLQQWYSRQAVFSSTVTTIKPIEDLLAALRQRQRLRPRRNSHNGTVQTKTADAKTCTHTRLHKHKEIQIHRERHTFNTIPLHSSTNIHTDGQTCTLTSKNT